MKIVFFFVCMFMSAVAQANSYTGWRHDIKVKNIMSSPNFIRAELETKLSQGCNSSGELGAFQIERTSPNFNEAVSMLLAAKIQSSPISIMLDTTCYSQNIAIIEWVWLK